MVKNLHLVLLFVSIITFGNAYSQKVNVDSLESVLKSHIKEDTVKINLLNRIAFSVYRDSAEKSRRYATKAYELSDKLGFVEGQAESNYHIGLSYIKSDKKLSIEYFQKALHIAESIDYKTGMAKYLNRIGSYYKSIGEKAKAIEHLQRGIKIAEGLDNKTELGMCWLNLSSIYASNEEYDKTIEGSQIALKIFEEKGDKKNASNCFGELGRAFSLKGNLPIALDYMQKGLKLKEELNDSLGVGGSLSNIGNVYLGLCDFPKALDYYQQALVLAEQLNLKRMIATCYGNIGTTYQRMNNDQALEYFQKALVLSEELGTKMITASVYIYMGDYYLPKGDLDKALDSYLKALKTAEEGGLDRPASAAMNNVGTVYLKQKKYALALNYTLKAQTLANKIKLMNTQKDIHFQLSEIYAATNDYKKAYLNYKQFKELNDSLYGDENVKKITALEYTYKFEKEKQAIELQQLKKDTIQASKARNKRIIIISLIVCLILMTAIIVFIYRSSMLKQKTNLLLSKQKDEIEDKNEELLLLNEEISSQKDEISMINAEIQAKNSKLQELNATKDKFFGIIAHDLRNPFNAILGLSDILVTSSDQYNQERTMEMIRIMNTSAQNTYKLLENLLDWARAQTGEIVYNPKTLSVKDLIAETTSLCKSLAMEKNISIHYNIPDDLYVYADQNSLNTVLRNLITNAIKFTHKGGNVSVSSTVQYNEAIITVSDTGIGMAEETRSKLFNITEKISVIGTESESGTGLGLILCKEFVEKNGGKIWVDSELGKGSDFKFSIPLMA
jgi:signal transduction histidine kinase